MANVTLYTTPTCPYCMRAKMLLDNKAVDFEEISYHSLSNDDRQALAQKTNNYRTVPQIFIGETFIGGYDQLATLERSGKLDTMLSS